MSRYGAAALTLGLLVAAALFWLRGASPLPPQSPVPQATTMAVAREKPETTIAVSAPAEPAPSATAALLETPEVQRWQQRQAFDASVRDFFATATTLDPAERQRRAERIEQGIADYESLRQLSAGEASNLRLGLIQASEADEGRRAERMAEVRLRYQLDAQRREAQWAQQQAADPGFARYKERERVVVAEVMALTTIPQGLSREEYLRRRLQAEREALAQ